MQNKGKIVGGAAILGGVLLIAYGLKSFKK